MPQRKGREDRGASRERRAGDRPSAAILDVAFRRAYRATPKGASRLDRARRRALLKIVRSAATTTRQLRHASRRFMSPPLTKFQWSLVDRHFGDGVLGRAIDRVRRGETRIRGLSVQEQRSLRTASGEAEFGSAVRRFYGRMASFVREVDPDLETLRAVDRFLDERPQLDPNLPTLVVAGFPNVGKSSLVGRLTRAHPKIADYPFTTLSVSAGHADLGFDRLQVVDTPGVLGRRRRANPAEREAVTAVERAATIVLFVIDPTETSGYPVDDQERLLARWQEEFPTLPFLVVETKSDLVKRENERPKVSATTGEGLDALREDLQGRIRELTPPSVESPDEPPPSDEIERVAPLRRANPK